MPYKDNMTKTFAALGGTEFYTAVLAGTAHLPSMEQPALFNQLVLEFLAKAGAKTSWYVMGETPGQKQTDSRCTLDQKI